MGVLGTESPSPIYVALQFSKRSAWVFAFKLWPYFYLVESFLLTDPARLASPQSRSCVPPAFDDLRFSYNRCLVSPRARHLLSRSALPSFQDRF